MLGPRTKVLRKFPLFLGGVTPPHTESAPLCGFLPLVEDAERTHKKGSVSLGLLHETQDLNRLPKAHLITQDTPAGRKSFALDKPTDTCDLMVLVVKSIPKRLKRWHFFVVGGKKSVPSPGIYPLSNLPNFLSFLLSQEER
jgi:hypothetical protein